MEFAESCEAQGSTLVKVIGKKAQDHIVCPLIVPSFGHTHSVPAESSACETCADEDCPRPLREAHNCNGAKKTNIAPGL